MIAVHVTHEAVEKMGGIGSVIAGLVTSENYREAFPRTVLLGPLFTTDKPANERLGAGGRIIYSSLDDIDTDGWSAKFKPIEQTYQVGIVYGIRKLADHLSEPVDVEVLLVDVFRANRNRLNLFKGELFAKFGVPSDEHEKIWEFEQYVRLAEPGYEAMHVIGCEGTADNPVVYLSHEYMGLPTALKAIMDGRPHVKTAFYAHEVASVRRVVERHPGHDLMFYNLLVQGEHNGRSLEDYFPDVTGFFKHPLIKAGARHCDAIFAVGDMVGREMRFIDPGNRNTPLEMTYNGVPSGSLTLEQRQEHRGRIKEFAHHLFGVSPDYVMTHVARPVLSKGIWRDLGILHELEPQLARHGRSAVYVLLGTLAGQRSVRDVLHMEKSYGWPVHHARGYPDLCNGEETLSELFEEFNRRHEAIRVVLVNQFGWERRLCGLRLPEDSSFSDIRCGSDVEFGLSVYEPFGISQLEPLSFGAICLVSNVCGCLDFARSSANGVLPANVLEADYTVLPPDLQGMDALAIGMAQRDAVEAAENRRLADELFRRLPVNERDVAELLRSGWELGRRLDWDEVVRQCFLPAVNRMWQEEAVLARAAR